MKYALFYGPRHLVLFKVKENFFWLVDIVIIYALLTAHNESKENYVKTIFNTWLGLLQNVVDDKLRARISWHVIEIDFVRRPREHLPLCFLQSVAYSPEGYFNEKEIEIAHWLLLKDRHFVEPYFGQVDVMPLAVWRFPLTDSIVSLSGPQIKAVGLSYDKRMAAVALRDGMISVVSLPRLVKLWDCSTHYEGISCCTFAPDDSFALFGKLETVLNIAERKEVPFFHGIEETFTSCAFSPSGNRLVTSDGSKTVKLWDVAKQSLLSSLCADCSVNWCSFGSTGLFIIADSRARSGDFNSNEMGVFCAWNAITQQRSDERNVLNMELNDKNIFHSKQCRRCFRLNHMIYYSGKPFTAPKRGFWEHLCSTGVYSGVECIIVLYCRYLSVRESIHLSTLAGWNFFVDRRYLLTFDFNKITQIEDDLWFYGAPEKIIVFRTKAPTPPKQELTCPTEVFSTSFSPDGSRLAACTSDGCIKIWNVDTSKVEQCFKCNHNDLPF